MSHLQSNVCFIVRAETFFCLLLSIARWQVPFNGISLGVLICNRLFVRRSMRHMECRLDSAWELSHKYFLGQQILIILSTQLCSSLAAGWRSVHHLAVKSLEQNHYLPVNNLAEQWEIFCPGKIPNTASNTFSILRRLCLYGGYSVSVLCPHLNFLLFTVCTTGKTDQETARFLLHKALPNVNAGKKKKICETVCFFSSVFFSLAG